MRSTTKSSDFKTIGVFGSKEGGILASLDYVVWRVTILDR